MHMQSHSRVPAAQRPRMPGRILTVSRRLLQLRSVSGNLGKPVALARAARQYLISNGSGRRKNVDDPLATGSRRHFESTGSNSRRRPRH
jgi:hypothetical protein